MKVVFPLMTAIGAQADNRAWLEVVVSDMAALHITAFAVEGFINRVLCRHEDVSSPRAMMHFQKGVNILRERLLGADDVVKTTDATIGVVLKLASAAHFDGDYQASKQHMDGVRKMVDFRGGLDAFTGTFLLVEMMRYDLSIAMLNGANPVFFCQPSEPITEYPLKLLPESDGNMFSHCNVTIIEDMDGDLATAWLVMRRFCLLVNLGTQTQRRISLEVIHETMTAVMYRLLSMRFTQGSIDEAVRHGLLAFSYHVFLQWQDIRLPCHPFATAYRESILGLRSVDGVSSKLMLWLLMVGAVSIFGSLDEAWLKEELLEYTVKCQTKTWREMQNVLKSVMWIALLDDKVGASIYDVLGLGKASI